MIEDKVLQCTSCGADFTFTADEQEFFAQKGFQEPRRCKPCRDAAKQERRGRGGGGFGGGRGGFGGERPMYDAVCAGCGCETQVPFRPDGRKPVYCRECFRSQSSY